MTFVLGYMPRLRVSGRAERPSSGTVDPKATTNQCCYFVQISANLWGFAQ